MNQLSVFIIHLFFMLFSVEAQSPLPPGDISSQDAVTGFEPNLAVVVGIFFIMIVLTLILLVYAKFCHWQGSIRDNPQNRRPRLIRSRSQFSGIDKTVIESLPFFKFSSLKGSKGGLECAVCLSKFEDIEILRLLPKCKHAFHMNCIDQWLEMHSSCPLCRLKVSAEDLTTFAYSNSMRFLSNQTEPREDSNIELFVQREEDRHWSSRFSLGSSFRKIENGNKEEEAGNSDEDQKVLHKFKHRISISDVVFKNRWSSVSSSDLMFLNSEMLSATTSNRFSSLDLNNGQSTSTKAIENEQIIKIEELERKRLFESKATGINTSSGSCLGVASTSDSKGYSSYTSRLMNPAAEKRSMSDITAFSRFGFGDLSLKNRITESSLVGNNTKEERLRRLWLPIARRTVQWFTNRERSQQPQNSRQPLAV